METNKLKEVFAKYPRKGRIRTKIRNKIVHECNISTHVFYNWLRGTTYVPELAKPIIAKILNIEQSELFPEEEISI